MMFRQYLFSQRFCPSCTASWSIRRTGQQSQTRTWRLAEYPAKYVRNLSKSYLNIQYINWTWTVLTPPGGIYHPRTSGCSRVPRCSWDVRKYDDQRGKNITAKQPNMNSKTRLHADFIFAWHGKNIWISEIIMTSWRGRRSWRGARSCSGAPPRWTRRPRTAGSPGPGQNTGVTTRAAND